MDIFNIPDIQSLGDDIYIVKCGFCNGTGIEHKMKQNEHGFYIVHDIPRGVPCGICHSRGLLKIKSDDIPIVHNYCSGTGHGPLRSYRDYVEYKDVVCYDCRGSGVISLTGNIEILK